jgi:hypothetical protein
MEAAYRWTLNHVVTVDSPHALFRTEHLVIGGTA